MTKKKSSETSGVVDNPDNLPSNLFNINKIDIKALIFIIRGQKVMLDRDLAALYGVKTKRLNEVVKRNMKRFEGDDFMFRLTKDEAEYASLRSQIATLNNGRGSNIKYLPYAFTELGVAMLSSVLTSETTRAQLDAISSALAELQSDRARHTGCNPIGFNVPKQ